MMITTMTPEFFQQLILATLLAERSEQEGTDYEDGTYEDGVRDALHWVAGVISAPHKSTDYPEYWVPLAAAEEFIAEKGANEMLRVALSVDLHSVGSSCKTCGPFCRGCPDCSPVMGDVTYQAMFGDRQDEL